MLTAEKRTLRKFSLHKVEFLRQYLFLPSSHPLAYLGLLATESGGKGETNTLTCSKGYSLSLLVQTVEFPAALSYRTRNV